MILDLESGPYLALLSCHRSQRSSTSMKLKFPVTYSNWIPLHLALLFVLEAFKAIWTLVYPYLDMFF